MSEPSAEATPVTTITHQHLVKVELNPKSITKYLIPPVLFSLSLYAVVKTDGRMREITWSMMSFAAISVWNNLF